MSLAATIVAAQIIAHVIAPQTATVAIAPVSLFWDASTNAASYNVYIGHFHNSYERVIPAASNSLDVFGLEYGLNDYFAVTSVDTNGVEGDYSPEILLSPFGALNIFFPQPGTALQASRDLATWNTRAALFTNGVWHVRLDPTASREFYRTVSTNN